MRVRWFHDSESSYDVSCERRPTWINLSKNLIVNPWSEIRDLKFVKCSAIPGGNPWQAKQVSLGICRTWLLSSPFSSFDGTPKTAVVILLETYSCCVFENTLSYRPKCMERVHTCAFKGILPIPILSLKSDVLPLTVFTFDLCDRNVVGRTTEQALKVNDGSWLEGIPEED